MKSRVRAEFGYIPRSSAQQAPFKGPLQVQFGLCMDNCSVASYAVKKPHATPKVQRFSPSKWVSVWIAWSRSNSPFSSTIWGLRLFIHSLYYGPWMLTHQNGFYTFISDVRIFTPLQEREGTHLHIHTMSPCWSGGNWYFSTLVLPSVAAC